MPKRILVVDDEKHMVRLLQLNLEREGYEVVTAYDGADGLETARALKPDLVLLDITMPRMDGFEVLNALKSREDTEKTPVVILTARSKDADVFHGYESGADAYLTKPLHPSELTAVIRRMLDEHASPPAE
jgi:two-component system alkaline phosphatase synthesis response regulator PhoP/two-component system response regulator VicR